MKAYMKIVLVLLLVSMLVACSNGRFGNITASLDASEAGVEEDEGLKREFCKVSSLQEQYCLLENTVGETYCIDRSYAEDYKVGDVVIIDRPGDEEFVKRIVAVAGDTVNIQNGKVYVNGKEQVLDGPVGDTYVMDDSVPNPYKVGDNQVFVLGDNRFNSEDSRSFGAVSIDDLRGRLTWYIGRL